MKEIAYGNVVKVLYELEKHNQKFENRMIIVVVVTTILTISIMIIFPFK